MSESQSGGPGIESRPEHYLDLFVGSLEFEFLATLEKSQLVCLWSVAIFNNAMLSLNHFVSVVSLALLALML